MTYYLPKYTVYEVEWNPESRKYISQIAKGFGISQSVRIERKALRIAEELLKEMVEDLRIYTPVDTGELQASIDYDVPELMIGGEGFLRIGGGVFFPDSIHENSRGSNKPTNSWLADHLDNGAHAGFIAAGTAEFDAIAARF